jgi:hydrogenase maturation protease
MKIQRARGTVVLGYGNPGRQDDGLGPALASAIDALGLPDVTVDEAYQLNIEDAATLAEHEKVLFVDASKVGAEPYEIKKLTAAETISFSTHSVGPESVLAICEESFNRVPEAWILAIRGYDFALEEGLTPRAEKNLEKALAFVQPLIRRWRI